MTQVQIAEAPYYQQDGITIYCGDCQSILPSLAQVDAVIIDPPFGTKTADWDNEPTPEVWTELRRLCPQGPIAVFGYAKQLFRWAKFFDGLQLIGYIVWHKYNETMVSPGLTKVHQDIAVWGKSLLQTRAGNVREPYALREDLVKWHSALQGLYEKDKRGIGKRIRGRIKYENALSTRHPDGRRCSDLWRIPAPGAGFNAHLRNHPNEKPLEAMSRLCRLLTDPGQTILDCYMGSGTTIVAAQNEGRQAIGIEISEKYCDVAIERLRQKSLWGIDEGANPDATKSNC